LSSATVYGAWPNNPLPITEDAPLRPNPELAYAVQRAQAEQLLADWVVAAPDRTVAVLRPTVPLAEDGTSWIARSLAAAAGVRRREDDPPKQFVHMDDLAAAVDIARRQRLDGVFNVAPDGWVAGDVVRELSGAPPRLPLTSQAAARFDQLRWRFQRGPIPPGLLPFTTDAWVIANDRLKAHGWTPEWTNEEAYVAGTESKWWTMLSPKRKQEISLGLLGLLVAAIGLTTTLVARRAWRRAKAARSRD
ncbi:MAG TPA: NAD-dependent epimerase/dehydratase family protein, partial [Acidimicrobiales bacterium]